MRKVNLDIQDRLIASQTGNTTSTEFTQGSVRKVYLNFFDEEVA